MKAVVYTRYGTPDVLRIEEVTKPTPADNEVLIKVHAASINAADWHIMTADIFLARLAMGLLKPKNPLLGGDVAGVVEAVGKDVTQFRPGDAVYGDVLGARHGSFAEYVCAPENILVRKPAQLSFEEAAAVPLAGITALQGLRDKGGIQPGHKVLIQGASGGVGTYAVQLARHFGAEVTAVCSTKNLDMVRSLGADHVVDYTREDVTRSGQHFDLILGINGYHHILDYRRILNPNGKYVMVGGTAAQFFQALLLGPWVSKLGSRKMVVLSAKSNQQDLAFLTELLEAGQIAPVIDTCYPLSEVVAAFRYFGDTHPKGKVVITVAPEHA